MHIHCILKDGNSLGGHSKVPSRECERDKEWELVAFIVVTVCSQYYCEKKCAFLNFLQAKVYILFMLFQEVKR